MNSKNKVTTAFSTLVDAIRDERTRITEAGLQEAKKAARLAAAKRVNSIKRVQSQIERLQTQWNALMAGTGQQRVGLKKRTKQPQPPEPMKGQVTKVVEVAQSHHRSDPAESGNGSGKPVWFHLISAINGSPGVRLKSLAPDLEQFSNRKGGIHPILSSIVTRQRKEYFKKTATDTYAVSSKGEDAHKRLITGG